MALVDLVQRGAASDGPGAIGWQLLNGVVTIRWPEALPRAKLPK